MKKVIAFLLPLFAILSMAAQSPSAPAADSSALAPFTGTICYRITYPDIKDKALLAMLPDSQVVTFDGPWISTQSFGGLATQMGEWTLWNKDSGDYWLVSDSLRKVFSLPQDHSQKKAKLTKNTNSKKRILLGHPCTQYDQVHDQMTDSWWINDSLFIGKPAVDSLVKFVPTFFATGKRSIPLRMLRKSESGTTVVEAVQIIPMEGEGFGRKLPPQGVYVWEEFNPLLQRHPLTGIAVPKKAE